MKGLNFRTDFTDRRKSFSGREILRHWKYYAKNYRLCAILVMGTDFAGIIRKHLLKWKKYRAKKRVKRWRYQPVNVTEYAKWVDYLRTSKDELVEFTPQPYSRQEDDTKVYAFYLTQYHAIPENDHAHGKGFTEWTNVASASPQFIGHYQPKIPYDLGFYNLLMPGVMERQVEIAKAYGIYGFCFYYYWFSGKKLLEKPLEHFLHSDIDFHFHLCWATENWSKRWDGGENEIIVEQHLKDSDVDLFFNDLLPYISDPRYEQIDGKPLLIIYRVDMFDKEIWARFIKRINTLAIEHGFKGLHILCTNAFGFDKPTEYSCEGLVEFPPHSIGIDNYILNLPRLSPLSDFKTIDMASYIRDGHHLYNASYPIYKTCFPEWDNTPRKLYNNGFCFQMGPKDFRKWFTDNILWTQTHHAKNEQIVYINAWNEWGEGAILEPTTRLGYRNLTIVKQTLESIRK